MDYIETLQKVEKWNKIKNKFEKGCNSKYPHKETEAYSEVSMDLGYEYGIVVTSDFLDYDGIMELLTDALKIIMAGYENYVSYELY